jgi:predicted DNA-binding transcriptional regulator AlpA
MKSTNRNSPRSKDSAGRFLLPFKEVAATLAFSRETLYRKIRQGLFAEPIKQGNRSFFEPADVENYLSKLKRDLNPPIPKN